MTLAFYFLGKRMPAISSLSNCMKMFAKNVQEMFSRALESLMMMNPPHSDNSPSSQC